MPDVTIQVLTEADAAVLAALLSEFSGLQTTPQQAAERLRKSRGIEHPLLARVAGDVAGFASLRLHPYLGEDAPYAELSELYVRPAFRRRGVARALLLALETEARRSGATGWSVLTGDDNTAALAAYRAFGFHPFSVALQKWLGDERPYRVEQPEAQPQPKPDVHVRPYQPQDEVGWLRCRVLAFLDTAYYDDVHRRKEHYDSPAIELVAEADGQIVGLIDVECEQEPGSVCSLPQDPAQAGLAGMIWHLAVHPDYRRRGIGSVLLAAAQEQARQRGIHRFEAWTRDDGFVEAWYRSQGFQRVQSYHHVYVQPAAQDKVFQANVPGLHLVSAFAHYVGNDPNVLAKFGRVHRCNRYDLYFE